MSHRLRRRAGVAAAVLLVGAAFSAAAVPAGGAQAPDPTAGVDQRWIVTLAPGAELPAADLPAGMEVGDRMDNVGAVAVEATPEEIGRLRRDSRVAAVEEVRQIEPVLDVAGPAIGVGLVHALGLDGAGRQVAVVDTGVDTTHPTFDGAVVTEACFVLEAVDVPCPGGGSSETGPGSAAPPCATSSCYHGTHVAGVAVGRGSAGVASGIASGADLVAVRVFGMNRNRLVADTTSLVAGLDHVIGLRQGGAPIDVVNLSVSMVGGQLFTGHCDASPNVSAAVRTAIDQLTALGTLVVGAAGNDGSASGVAEPGCFSNLFAVGASDLASPERVAPFSNSGPPLDLLAPGVDIESAGPAGGAQVTSGTSAATPFVTGAVSVIRSADPSVTVPQLRGLLADGGVLVVDPARGWFLRLDVAASVLSLGDGIGVGRAGVRSYLRTSPTAGRPNRSVGYGTTTDRLLIGDWNGDGVDTYGVRRGATVILTDNPAGGTGQITFTYGFPTDEVIVGDWDGDGHDSIGIRRGNVFHLRNALSSGPGQLSFLYGTSTDGVVVGDWDGDGHDSIGLRRAGGFHLRNSLSAGPADLAFGYGLATDTPVVGDWTGQGHDTVGVRRGNRWLLRTTNTSGNAELDFAFGSATAPPLVGNWDGT